MKRIAAGGEGGGEERRTRDDLRRDTPQFDMVDGGGGIFRGKSRQQLRAYNAVLLKDSL